MAEILRPASEDELAAALAEASAKACKLAVQGGQSHAMLGRRVACDGVLDTTALTGRLDYDPAEMVLTAPAGTPIGLIEKALAAHRHMLAFEPPRLAWLADGRPEGGTIGGLVATNFAGSRRIAAGAVRDHVLGVRAVTGNGLLFKSGGRVVKNVTGYDLSKLLSGSFGTLGVLSEVTLRVVPRPEDKLTILIRSPDVATAMGLMGRALSCAQAVSGAAYLPSDSFTGLVLPADLAASEGLVAVRLEGFGETLPTQRDALLAVLDGFKAADVLPQAGSDALWDAIGSGSLLRKPAPSVLWRVSIPPSAAGRLLARFENGPDWRFFLDWGGGLAWLAHVGDAELSETTAAILDGEIRRSLAELGGHGALLQAPEAWRNRLNAFQPLSPAELNLSRRTKAAFDPAGILNPCFMYPAL